jgi:dUTP pyrophosphatase
MKVPFKKLHPDAVPPSYATPGDAGMDLTPVSLEAFFNDAGEQLLRYRFGLAFEIPEGYVGLIFPRSSICMKTSLMLTNSVGVIDSGYRGRSLRCSGMC